MTTAMLQTGDKVQVYAMGRWRPGTICHVTPTKYHVEWVSPSTKSTHMKVVDRNSLVRVDGVARVGAAPATDDDIKGGAR